MTQLLHHQIGFQQKSFSIILLLDEVLGEANIGSIFRLADAFGLEKLIFTGKPPNLKSRRLQKTSRNTYTNVTYDCFKDKTTAAKQFQKMGFKLIALEITTNSTPISTCKFKKEDKICLIVGNETKGVNNKLLELCESEVHIEMFGKNSSMNVAQATGIALYEITKSMHDFHKK